MPDIPKIVSLLELQKCLELELEQGLIQFYFKTGEVNFCTLLFTKPVHTHKNDKWQGLKK